MEGPARSSDVLLARKPVRHRSSRKGQKKATTDGDPSLVPATRCVEIAFITVGRTSHIREDARRLERPRNGRHCPHDKCSKQQSRNTGQMAHRLEPSSRHGRDEYDEQGNQATNQESSGPSKANQMLTGVQ